MLWMNEWFYECIYCKKSDIRPPNLEEKPDPPLDSKCKFQHLQQCCGSGSGIRAFLTPGSGIRDPGSGIFLVRIPDPKLIFWELIDNILGKIFYNSLKFCPNFFLQHFKNKIILHFVKFVATKKCLTTTFFSPLSFVAVFGSGTRDPGSGMGNNQDPGSGIRDKHPGFATLIYRLYASCSCQTLSFWASLMQVW